MPADHQETFTYSEIFARTIQGEGHYTGVPTAWIRWWGCNLQCRGFGQPDPEDPSTWLSEDLTDLDISGISTMQDLPVFRTGCDSSYSWSRRFRHLAHQHTASEIADKLIQAMTNAYNPQGLWQHPNSGVDYHFAITGGEPLLRKNQRATKAVLMEFAKRERLGQGDAPIHLTFETNGTQMLLPEIWGSQVADQKDWNPGRYNIFFSVSPKLSATSGEQWEKAIRPDIVASLHATGHSGQLKFVCNGTNRSWDQVEQAVSLLRKHGVEWPVWIMPVGARDNQQEDIQAQICEQTVDRGYNFAARVHCWVFGNQVGK